MEVWEIAGLALALGSDGFTVCLGMAMDVVSARRSAALCAIFGVMQAALLVAGYLVVVLVHSAVHLAEEFSGEGLLLGGALRSQAFHDDLHRLLGVLGALVLAALGLAMVWSCFDRGPRRAMRYRTHGVIALAVVTNIDAFSAGIGLGMIDHVTWPALVGIVLVVGVCMAVLGAVAGRSIGAAVGRVAQPLGGAVLLLIAIHFFISAL